MAWASLNEGFGCSQAGSRKFRSARWQAGLSSAMVTCEFWMDGIWQGLHLPVIVSGPRPGEHFGELAQPSRKIILD